MFLKNTSHYPDNLVKPLLEIAARDRDLGNVAVNIKNSSKPYYGRAYMSVPSIANVHKKAKRLVVVRIGSPDKFPVTNEFINYRWIKERDPPPLDSHSEEYREYWKCHRFFTRLVDGVQE